MTATGGLSPCRLTLCTLMAQNLVAQSERNVFLASQAGSSLWKPLRSEGKGFLAVSKSESPGWAQSEGTCHGCPPCPAFSERSCVTCVYPSPRHSTPRWRKNKMKASFTLLLGPEQREADSVLFFSNVPKWIHGYLSLSRDREVAKSHWSLNTYVPMLRNWHVKVSQRILQWAHWREVQSARPAGYWGSKQFPLFLVVKHHNLSGSWDTHSLTSV